MVLFSCTKLAKKQFPTPEVLRSTQGVIRAWQVAFADHEYYGNITLSERSFRRTGEYAHILQLATRNEEKLSGTLTEAQKEAFGKFKDSTSELSSMTEVTAFTLGFKLGLRLTAEAFVTGSDDQNLMKE